MRIIDVSHHQGDIDWPAVAASGVVGVDRVEGAIIKISEGLSHTDDKARRNLIGARAAGLVVGAYHFFRPTMDAKKQAEFFLSHLTEADFPLLIASDFESCGEGDWDQFGAMERQEMVNNFLDTLTEALILNNPNQKQKVFVYFDAHFANNYLQAVAFAFYHLWLAKYAAAVPAGWANYTIWQYSEKGHTAGVQAPCDLDRFEGTKADLEAMGASGLRDA